jgi:uncharacterized membrane protein
VVDSEAVARPAAGDSMNLSRLFRHLVSTGWSLRGAFTSAALDAIEQAVAAAERTHGGEIRVAIENSLSPAELAGGVTPRERALQAFGQLGFWDTEANNGVLIYVLWADRDVEIVADRGYNGRVSAQEWADACQRMEQVFANGDARQALVLGIGAVGALIARHYPPVDRDGLPNRPVLI